MYRGPHFTIYYHPSILDNHANELLRIEHLIPGVVTWTHTGGSGKGAMKALRNRLAQSRFKRADDAADDTSNPLADVQTVWMTVPSHAGYLMASLPDDIKVIERFIESRNESKAAGFSWLPKVNEALETSDFVSRGAGSINRLVQASAMTKDQANRILARWYQSMLSSICVGRNGLLLRADGGSGKSVGSVATLLAWCLANKLQRILILCPAEVRDPFLGWPMEVKTFTEVEPFVFLPPKSPLWKKAPYKSVEEYLSRGQQPRGVNPPRGATAETNSSTESAHSIN